MNLMTEMDLQPHLTGELLELRPLVPGDWDELFAAAADPLIWEQHPACDRYQEEVFRAFFQDALESKGAFVAVDRETGKIIGSSRYFWNEIGELEIGWTFLARSHWANGYNKEMKRLMMDHAFRHVDSVVFLIGTTNFRSRKAVEKIGGVLTGRSCDRTIHGKSVEHVIYRIRKTG